MAAYNAGMPRSSTLEANGDFAYSPPYENPGALGARVIMSPFSGPKGSPLDALQYPADVYMPEVDDREAATEDTSTGALSTGIGIGLNANSPGIAELFSATDARKSGNFTDNVIPGITMPDGTTAATEAILLAIGGGRTDVEPLDDDDVTDFSRAEPVTNPYSAVGLNAFGGGVSRDAGAGPAFTGFEMKVVTAPSDIAAGAVVETGYKNYSGEVLKTGFSQFGSAVAAAVAPAMVAEEEAELKKASAKKPPEVGVKKPAAPAPSKTAPAPTKK